MVRVLAVADEEVPVMHARARDLRVDLVVSAGDLPWDYLQTLVEVLDVPALFVPGNHEPAATGTSSAAPRGMINADGRVLEVAGLRFAGLGGCVRYNSGEHQYTQGEYDRRVKRLVRGVGTVDVLVTHAPPLGLGDATDPSHLGISALHGALEALRPSWHLHGHIHPYGMRKIDRQVGATMIRNVIPWDVIDVEPQSAPPTAAHTRTSA